MSTRLVPKRVNREAAFDYLCRQEPPFLQSMFEGIYELEPGTWMEIDLSGTYRSGAYFRLEDDWRHVDAPPSRMESLLPLVEDKIRTCVQRQLVSDVPVGIALSGGIDSALVYKEMAGEIPETLHAFTYANASAEINEFGKASDVVKRFGGEALHHVIHVTLPDYLELFQEACRFLDGPVVYPSSIPILMLSRLASQTGIKVLMSGQGGDELFMGYVRYGRWIEQGMPEEKNIETWAEHFYYGAGLDNVGVVERLTGVSRDVVLDTPTYQWVFKNQDIPPLKRMAIFDQKFRLGTLLKRDDRMGMGGSVEIRVPLLDKELVSWVNAVDERWKINGSKQKFILNMVGTSAALPRSVTTSPKLGSPVDFTNWISTHEFAVALMDLVNSSQSFSRNFLVLDEVRQVVRQHRRYEYLSWCLFSMENWYQACFHDSTYPG